MAWATETNLKNALNANTWIHLFDDDGDGTVAEGGAAVTLVLERAHEEVLSHLPNLYATIPSDSPIITLLKSCELDFAYTLALERRPELVKSMGEEAVRAPWNRALKRMDRIRESIQRITANHPGSATGPANIGGDISSGIEDDSDVADPHWLDGAGDF